MQFDFRPPVLPGVALCAVALLVGMTSLAAATDEALGQSPSSLTRSIHLQREMS